MSLLFSFLLACSATKGTDSGTSDDTATQSCGVEISATYPYLNATDMYYRSMITITLSQEDAGASVILEDAQGNSIDGTATNEGTTLSFQPLTPLTPSTDYIAKVDYCGSEELVSIPFRTSDLGTPLSGGIESLQDMTFAVDLTSGIVVEPVGVGELLRGLLENTFLIHVDTVSTNELTVVSALSQVDSIDQDFCTPTLNDFPAVNIIDAPFFSLSAESLELTVAAYSARVYNFAVYGTFASDASYFGGAYLEGEIDAREIQPLLADFGIEAENADDVCNLLINFGVPCIECSSDGEAYCLRLVLDQLVANAIESEIYPVCSSNCHNLCTENLETCNDPQTLEETCE